MIDMLMREKTMCLDFVETFGCHISDESYVHEGKKVGRMLLGPAIDMIWEGLHPSQCRSPNGRNRSSTSE